MLITRVASIVLTLAANYAKGDDMRKRKEILKKGDRFGLLEILGDGPDVNGVGRVNRTVICKCDCGNVVVKRIYCITTGDTKSCGCLSKTHGKSGSREHIIWKSMIQRCANKNRQSYKDYGGRGISVCERWKKFENFLSDMGIAPNGSTIDRIDNDGNYEPSNCRWATHKEQSSNKRCNVVISAYGKTKTAKEWAREIGISEFTIYARVKNGFVGENALSKTSLRYKGNRPLKNKLNAE